jgi:hypothetical protein
LKQLTATKEKERMAHLLKTAKQRVTRRRRKSKYYYSPYVRPYSAKRERAKEADVSPEESIAARSLLGDDMSASLLSLLCAEDLAAQGGKVGVRMVLCAN